MSVETLYGLTEADRQRLTAVLGELPPSSQNLVLQCVRQAAAFDPRPLPGAIPFLGPTLRDLPPASCTKLLERIARLAQVFPAGVAPLFRALGRVYDEVGEETSLAWITAGEAIARRNAAAGTAFFTLTSRTSLLTLRGASATVYLSDIQGVLLKYLHMLSGAAIGLAGTERVDFPPPLPEDAGEVVLLPFSIERFSTYEENFQLYRVLAAHQAGRIEFGSYTCVPSGLWSLLSSSIASIGKTDIVPPDTLVAYFRLFPRPDLMEDLFLCVEGKRIAARLVAVYPGLQADLAWAESLPEFTPPEIAAVLARAPQTAWECLCRTGSASDSLLLATRLYAEYLRREPQRRSGTLSRSAHKGSDDEAEGSMAFLTGVELEDEDGAASAAEEGQAVRQRRALTAADLRYVYDEWDYEIEDYRPHWCEVRETPLVGDEGAFFSKTVTAYADLIPELKRELQRLRPRMYRQVKGLEDGEEIDLNAAVAARVDRLSGVSPSPKLYMARQLTERDVAVLFLLDLSASTALQLKEETAAEASSARRAAPPRIIDVIKEAVVLLSMSLEEVGDAYAIYGFSSNGRYDVELYPVKTFADALSVEMQGRIGALTSQGSTRMGAAVRHATRRLKEVGSRTKLLVLLSDGYPEDAGYGKPVTPPMYGLRDTLMALREAERSGILSFCLTVDKAGRDYLREMCPSSRYLVIEDIQSLPLELPKIYQRSIWAQTL